MGPQFFINRPIFASVLSIIIVIAGGLSLVTLPIAQYPEITPPTVEVSASYPGANAQDVAVTVATPIEEQVNGVENMLYMESKSTSDGQMILTVTFAVGTDLNMAQVLVQNRVNLALPKVPEIVRSLGVSNKKKSPSIILVVNLFSPDESRDQLYLSNFAALQVKDELSRVPGVGDVKYLGEREYSMRIWLDPLRLATKGLTPIDVVNAIREQNQQVAAGQIGQNPVPPTIRLDFQNTINVQGRLTNTKEFEEMVIKIGSDESGKNVRIVRLKEVAEVELGSKNYDIESTLNGKPSIGLAIYQLPGSNALETAGNIRKKMDEIMRNFWPDKDPAKRDRGSVDYGIFYDTTPFIEESIHEVQKTFFEALALVAIVVLVFLQSWRATLIPLIAVPVAIIGTFALMKLFGFSLNNLSLFGLVLAIGIVVDDAIVVVEAVELHLARGLSPKDATRKAMSEVSGPIVAISLVLCGVFVPTAFISGITGQFYQQFALTIAVSTLLSALNSLTLSPALCGILLKPHHGSRKDPLEWLIHITLGWFFKLFNKGFDVSTTIYTGIVKILIRGSVIVLVVYGGLLYLTGVVFSTVPTGFIPNQDKGYLIIDIRLPDAASLRRTKLVTDFIDILGRSTPGVNKTIGVPGLSIITGANSSNVGTFFYPLKPFHDRHKPELYSEKIANSLRGTIAEIQNSPINTQLIQKLYEKHYKPVLNTELTPELSKRISESCDEIKNSQILFFGPPPVDGLGSAGGFKLHLQDKGNLGYGSLQGIGNNIAQSANAQPGLVGVANTFRANAPQVEVKIDREKAKAKWIDLNDVFHSLQYELGSYYVNDITLFGKNYQVNVQARSDSRTSVNDIGRLRVRNRQGQVVMLGTFCDINLVSGPSMVTRYNMAPSAPIIGGSLPGISSGQAIGLMQQIVEKEKPDSMGYEWTDLSYQEVKVGNTSTLVFALSVLLVFLILAAQYESWGLPLAVILIVPMCLLCAATGVMIARMDINIFTQIGLVVLVGLASKNAILIVEFAKQRKAEGVKTFDAAIEASKLRLRPILMTSFAFILGVVPLVLSSGAGAEMRQTLGTAVFSGMLGVTVFGIFFTPVFYYLLQKLLDQFARAPMETSHSNSTNHSNSANTH